jgi:phenylpropionate dioxygenase-like ring-hydroxylating dioxygenase large terminal subunit
MSDVRSNPYKGNRRFHDDYPEMGTGPVSTKPYYCEEQFQQEKEFIFKKVWLNAGRVEQIPAPGDFFVKDLPICDTSVIIVRDGEGSLNAFHNMCSHRGNKIAYDKKGNVRTFACRFHGWDYDLNGNLLNVPDEENYFDLDKSCLGLSPVHVGEWGGFIFVNVDPDPEETLETYLGDLGVGLGAYPFGETSGRVFTFETVVDANWKLVKDAFQEVCHTPWQHNRSLPDAYISADNPHTRFVDMAIHGYHARASLFGNMGHQPSPVATHAYQHGSTIAGASMVDGEAAAPAMAPPLVNPTGSADWSFELSVFFPSFFLAVTNGSYFTHQFLPLGVDKTHWFSTTCYPKPTTAAQQFSQEYSRVMFRDIMLEDGRQIEETQTMINSGAKDTFVLKDEELFVRQGLWQADKMIAKHRGAS